MEICYGLIPLALSFIFFIYILPKANKNISETYYISNSTSIIGIYLASIFIKVKNSPLSVELAKRSTDE